MAGIAKFKTNNVVWKICRLQPCIISEQEKIRIIRFADAELRFMVAEVLGICGDCVSGTTASGQTQRIINAATVVQVCDISSVGHFNLVTM